MNGCAIRILAQAAEDLELGKAFYRVQDEGLGDYFTSSLLSDIRSLRFYAGIHPTHFGYHRMLGSRFPFSVYYEFDGETASVVAILDMRRNPKSIRAALQKRKRQQGGRA